MKTGLADDDDAHRRAMHDMLCIPNSPSYSTLGISADRSIPASLIASKTAGFTISAGARPGRADLHKAAGQLREEGGGHLRASGVVHAHEQHRRLAGGGLRRERFLHRGRRRRARSAPAPR